MEEAVLEYISVKEAADTWGLTARMVLYHCTNGRIEGARKISNVWLIPKDAAHLRVAEKETGANSL